MLEEPTGLETPKLPCLETLMPAPARINELMVEILKVFLPSPPVPHTSMVSYPERSTGRHNLSKASLKPASSVGSIFRIRNTVRKDEISISEKLFLPIFIRTSSASVRLSFPPPYKYSSVSFMRIHSFIQPVFDQFFPQGSQDRFRVELYSFNLKLFMAQRHNAVFIIN